ncbi:MAG: hypothetical protein ACREXU_16835 [Gammaproteobacteria bacterium]
MDYVRAAIGAVFIFAGLAIQGLGWLLDRAGWCVECIGSNIAEW